MNGDNCNIFYLLASYSQGYSKTKIKTRTKKPDVLKKFSSQ